MSCRARGDSRSDILLMRRTRLSITPYLTITSPFFSLRRRTSFPPTTYCGPSPVEIALLNLLQYNFVHMAILSIVLPLPFLFSHGYSPQSPQCFVCHLFGLNNKKASRTYVDSCPFRREDVPGSAKTPLWYGLVKISYSESPFHRHSGLEAALPYLLSYVSASCTANN